MEYTVKTLSVRDVPILTALFKYKDVNEMIAENTKDMVNGYIYKRFTPAWFESGVIFVVKVVVNEALRQM